MNIGILGGTFNPIHLGHIKLAEEAIKKLKLDKVIFVPAYSPPHKSDEDIIPWQDRYEMVRLSLSEDPRLEVSDIEKKLEGTSYSINTIKEFKKVYGESAEVFFITGSDSVEELKTWKDIDDLKRLCKFVIATRPGYKTVTAPKDTIVIETDTPDISSSDIRRLIKTKRSFKELLHKDVYYYIINKKLYL